MRRVAVILLVAGAIVAASAVYARAQAPPLFVPGPNVHVGPGSGHLVLRDVNHDGHADLIAQHLLRRLVQVRLGSGTGRFPPFTGSTLRLGYQPGAIAVGDLDADGSLDLVVARRDQTNEYVHVLYGDGLGRFHATRGSDWAVNERFAFYKPTIRVVDVDGDGKRDIVTSNGRRNTIEILLGDGRRSFAPAATVTLAPRQDSHSYELGDVDGDGRLDLVVSSRIEGTERARLAVLRGDGSGAFSPAATSRAVRRGGQIAALADLDRDGRLDVVLTHVRSTWLSLLLGSGNGSFTKARTSPYRLPAEAFAVVVADVNRDGQRDVLATTVNTEATGYAASLAVLLNDGAAFTRAPGSPFRTARGAYNLALGDVDGDGRLDVATSSFEGSQIQILLGR